MSPSQIREPVSFGKRAEPHTVLITRNGQSRLFTIKPVVFSVFLGVMFMFMVGYFSATAYLVFRDDLINASYARQARVQYEYEDRIAALRAKLDRVTSRQLLDQQAIEARVRDLIARQDNLGNRGTRMNGLLEKAKAHGLQDETGSTVPTITPKIQPESSEPVKSSSIDVSGSDKLVAFAGAFSLRGSLEGNSKTAQTSVLIAQNPDDTGFQVARNIHIPEMTSRFTESLFGEIANSIGTIDASQRQKMDSLRIAASGRSKKIASVLASAGFAVPGTVKRNIGGPFIPLDQTVDFSLHLEALDDSLTLLNEVTQMARSLPLYRPTMNGSVSSRFGSRVDPFNGRMAMHSGMDFKASRGTPVHAAGSGIVIKAGRKGGYGKIVEIKHSNGYTTRYAHLSRILVRLGQKVDMEHIIGKVGTTGRSTGPHLHYEVRKNDKPINPMRFLKAAKNLKALL